MVEPLRVYESDPLDIPLKVPAWAGAIPAKAANKSKIPRMDERKVVRLVMVAFLSCQAHSMR
ncbi:hypothetical protein GCM10028801_10710 [Nocardioides maradonensis]